MPVRSEMDPQLRTRPTGTIDAKLSARRSAPPHGSHQGPGQLHQPSQEPQIIECRKKNSSGESLITHRYRKGRLLGKGGFAHCHKVTCIDTGKVYAMKIVPKSTLVKSRARQKLQTEIKIHRTLQHPRIVRFETFFEDRENVYILLELCANHSLSELIRKTKRFTEAEARRYMLQILEATSYLHRHQIIHRDLKLGNVFLDSKWNVKMGDFGLATKLVQDSERKRTICGTPNYIAPEILEGTAGHSYQVDLWSAGVILYTMLVGRPPYESTDVKSTYRRILANVYAFPESVPVSDSAKDLVGRLLQVKPELRPSLDDILNHPFLRNGGPRQRFSTVHGLRGSSASTATATHHSAGNSSGSAGGAHTTPGVSGRGTQKHTPERYPASQGGVAGRPPLKTRSSNVDTEAEVPREVARVSKPRAVNDVGAVEGGARDTYRRRGANASSREAQRLPGSPSGARLGAGSGSDFSSAGARAAVPRTGSSRGFAVYCDTHDLDGVGAGEAPALSGKRASPRASGRRREERSNGCGSGSGSGNGSGDAKSSVNDKENNPLLRRALGSGGTRVPVNGPVSRRPLLRSASTSGAGSRGGGAELRAGSALASAGNASAGSTSSSSGGGGSGGGGGGGGPAKRSSSRVVGLRRSASAVGTRAEAARSSAAMGGRTNPGASMGGNDVKAAGSARGATAAAAGSPRLQVSSRGATSNAAKGSYSPYRPLLLGATVNAHAGAAGEATPPRRTTGGGAQQKLDFGSTPRSTRQRAASSGPGVGGQTQQAGRRPATCAAAGHASPSPTSAGTRVRLLASGSGGGGADNAAKVSPSSTPGPAATAATVTPTARRVSAEPERDSLEVMHERLASGFAAATAAVGAAVGAAGRATETLGSRWSPTTAYKSAAAAVEADTPPSVWVTRYVDYSSKYGLGFLLSDGSAGVYFNDATKIVLEPAGVSFDYMERARRSAYSGEGEAAGEKASSSTGRSRVTHTLDSFPPHLQKKVTLLNHFRGYLHELVKKSDAAAGDGDGEAGRLGAGDGDLARGKPEEPLVFLKKWLRTRNAILFRLSNLTVQVVFSDNTEVLLSKEGRLVTFVDRDGRRGTRTLEAVLQDQRPDINKRLRYSTELIAQLLRRV